MGKLLLNKRLLDGITGRIGGVCHKNATKPKVVKVGMGWSAGNNPAWFRTGERLVCVFILRARKRWEPASSRKCPQPGLDKILWCHATSSSSIAI
jgi:hypothetical protein